jgi:hypothetical protein
MKSCASTDTSANPNLRALNVSAPTLNVTLLKTRREAAVIIVGIKKRMRKSEVRQ